MKNHLYLLAFLLFLCACIGQKELQYNIPAELPEAQRATILAQIKKGELLYKDNCASCHGIFGKGKKEVPNFSQKQLDGYKARHTVQDPKNHAVSAKLQPQELDAILMFLAFVKKEEPKKSATK